MEQERGGGPWEPEQDLRSCGGRRLRLWGLDDFGGTSLQGPLVKLTWKDRPTPSLGGTTLLSRSPVHIPSVATNLRISQRLQWAPVCLQDSPQTTIPLALGRGPLLFL